MIAWKFSCVRVLICGLLLVAGCNTYHQDGRLSDPQLAILRAVERQDTVVGVRHLSPAERSSSDPDSYYPFADQFQDAMRGSGLFAKVEYADRLGDSPDLYVRLDWGREMYLCEPLLTVLTIGVIPTPCKEKATYNVLFRKDWSDPSKGEIKVRVEKEITRWYGLLMGPLNLFPGFGWKYESASLADQLVFEVSKHIQQLRLLAAQAQGERLN